MTSPILEVENLGIALRSGGRMTTIVDGVSFAVGAGEVLSIVGESGSGKSMTARALMGLLPGGAKVTGTARMEGSDILNSRASEAVRGVGIGMIFQEPMTALNPVLTIGRQMTEALVSHGLADQAEAEHRAVAMLERVGIEGGHGRLRQYPHEFSGGMRQRVMIAMTMLLEPRVLIADEPTTALDVTVQAQILALLTNIVDSTGIGLVLITHDMGVVAETASRVLVMRGGNEVESAPVGELFAAPRDPYTQALLAAVPRLDRKPEGGRPETDFGEGPAIVRVEGAKKTFAARRGPFGGGVGTKALDDVSLSIRAGETLALVGESGSGKSTLGRAVTRLMELDEGSIEISGTDLQALRGAALRQARRKVQMIFQDPYSSLDPRFTVGRTVAEPIRIHERVPAREARERARALIDLVGLPKDAADRYPHEFSGGQRQRIAVSRALAAEPDVVVADEPTSALDVSVQAQVLDLIMRLKTERKLTLLFISHDLAVVRQIADRVAVMRSGRILELGPTDAVLDDARHPYTRALIAAAPIPDPTRQRGARPKVAVGGPTGALAEVAPGHWAAQ